MRLLWAILFTAIGGAVVVIGIVGALSELIGLYSSALNDAMAEGPEPKAIRSEMIQWAITGATGIPFLLIGSVMLKITMFQKLTGRGRKGVKRVDWTVPAAEPDQPAPVKPEAQPPKHGAPRRDNLGESGGNKSEQ
jgi:hypothetical protein